MKLQSGLSAASATRIATTPESIKPFTYFRDKSGYIFWAHRFVRIREVDGFWATLVYSPDPKGSRYSLSSGLRYSKTISHGLKYELPTQITQFPSEIGQRISELATEHPKTGEQMLFVRVSEVSEIHDQKDTLNLAMSNKCQEIGLSQESCKKINAAVKLLESVGIPLKDIGLYGALQSRMVRNSPEYSGQIHDIDMLINGIEHYDAIMSIAPGSIGSVDFSHLANNEHRTVSVSRRCKLTQPRLAQYPDTNCDLRMVRKEDDRFSFPALNDMDMSGSTIFLAGTVIGANESLVMPYVYEVESDHDGQAYSICGRYYDYLGAATVGDKVEVVGKLVGLRTILLVDPKNNYIKCSNCK